MSDTRRLRPADVQTVAESYAALQRLCKWRMHFAGWLLGSRPKTDPQSQWARDNAEKLLVLRAEASALSRILIDRGVCTAEELTIQVGQEAVALTNAMEERWPGITTTDRGLSYDLRRVAEAGWMKGWLP